MFQQASSGSIRHSIGTALALALAGMLMWFSLSKAWWSHMPHGVREWIPAVAGVLEGGLAILIVVRATRGWALTLTSVAFAGAIAGTAYLLLRGDGTEDCRCLGHIRLSLGVSMLVHVGLCLVSGSSLLLTTPRSAEGT